MRKSNADFVLPSHSKTPVHRVTDDYKRLLKAIKLQNPSINILVSSIIPRPFDFDANKDYLISVLKDMAKETSRCEYLPSYRSLMKRNHPKENCFKKCDGLHLSEDGTITLKRYFICKIVELFRKI